MSGRHRKPTNTGLRIARVGALTVMATVPLAVTGTALASPVSPTPTDRGSSRLTDRDSSDWADQEASRWDDDANWSDDDSPSWSDDDSGSVWDDSSDDDSPSWSSRHSRLSDDRLSDDDWASSAEDNTPRWSGRGSARPAVDDIRSWRRHTPASSTRHTPTGSTRHGSSSSGTTHATAENAKWDQLAQCESTQNWDANTGNGYKGGLQFNDTTWRSYGGRQYAPSADRASRDEQIAVAKKVQREQGWRAWPGCSQKLGYA